MSIKTNAIVFGAAALSIVYVIGTTAANNTNRGNETAYSSNGDHSLAPSPETVDGALKTITAVSQGIDDQLVYCSGLGAQSGAFWETAFVRCTPIN